MSITVLNKVRKATDEVLQHLAQAGYDPQYGARPLKRVLQRQVLNELSKAILAGDIKPHAVVEAQLGDDGTVRFVNVEVPAL